MQENSTLNFFIRYTLLLFVSLSFSQNPDVLIRIEDPSDSKIGLGLVEWTPFRNTDPALPVSIGQVIKKDLEFSGRVKITEAGHWDSSTKSQLLSAGIAAYIHGEYQYDGQTAKIKCHLRDTESGEVIISKKYQVTTSQIRRAAHAFSDEIVYQLFGEKGIAQTQIVYISKESGVKEVSIMDYDGANVQQITKTGKMHLLPCWLRDNKSIMYTSYKANRPQLYTKLLPNGPEKLFIESQFLNVGCQYNTVDAEIAFTSSVRGNTEIFRISESGTNLTRLTYSNALESSPSWAPNGYELAFTSNRAGNPMIYIMDRDGANIRRLTYEGKYNTSPAWSPRGDKIAFCSMSEGGKMDIYTISPQGTDLRQLTSGVGNSEDPSWSPDGRAIVFTSNRRGKNEVYRMREDGSHQEPIATTGNNTAPRWSHFVE